MAERKPLYMDQTEGFPVELPTTDSITLGGLTMNGGDIAMGTNKITGLGDPTNPQDGATKAYVDEKALSPGKFKELILHENQLDNSLGILAAGALTIQTNPVGGDTVVISDGVTTRTYGATSGGDIQYTIGGTPAITMQNLATAIQGDGSAIWGAYFTTDLDRIDTDGMVVIVEDSNAGAAPYVYGTWGTQANCEIVNYGADYDYADTTLITLPTPTPGATNFGFRRVQASVDEGEMHYSSNDDVLYAFDDDANVWNSVSGAASIPDATSGSGGAVKGKVTFDSDKGLSITSGVGEILIDDTPNTLDVDSSGLKVVGLPSLFEVNDVAVGATVTAANLDTLTDTSNADALHTHASGTTSTVEAAYAVDEAIAIADPVYWTATGDRVGKALSNNDAKARVIGVAKTAQATPGSNSTITSHGPCTGTFVGQIPGAAYYLQAAGGIGTSLPGASNRVIQVGVAKNATDLWVRIVDYGKKAS